MTRPTLDHALQIARDVDLEGPGPILSPDVVTWLAGLALGHPQVSAAVAAALPSSGVRWAGAWGRVETEGLGVAVRVGPDGTVLGQVERAYIDTSPVWLVRRRWTVRILGNEVPGTAESADAARAEVDERLLAAGYTLLGAVYRQAGREEPAAPCPRCAGQGAYVFAGGDVLCGDCEDGRLLAERLGEPRPAPFRDLLAAETERRATFRDLAAAAERDMPAGLLAGPPEDDYVPPHPDSAGHGYFDPQEDEYPCTRCSAGPGRVWGTTWDTVTTAYDCPHCDGRGTVPRA